MGKKYTPSGYQIINIDVSARTSGIPFTPETEDEKLLHEILSSGEIKKPILLNVITSLYGTITAFPIITDNSSLLRVAFAGYQLSISVDGDDLSVAEVEE